MATHGMDVHRSKSFDWAFWFFWIMATTWGWILGGFLVAGIALLITGLAVAILQWLVLKQRIGRSWRWISVTGIGWAAGWVLVVAALPEFDFMHGLVLGAATGLAQWTVLRREVYWAGWWIVISTIAWTTGLTLLPGALTSGVIPGALTGIALELLLRNPKTTEIPASRL